jgi:hypothetical protein
MFNIDLSTKPSHLFIKFGAAVECGISGKEKFQLIDGNTISRKMKFSFGDYSLITSSALIQVGYETANGILIFGHYSHGLSSLNNADYGPNIKHRIAGISIGKYFSRIANVIDTRVRE